MRDQQRFLIGVEKKRSIGLRPRSKPIRPKVGRRTWRLWGALGIVLFAGGMSLTVPVRGQAAQEPPESGEKPAPTRLQDDGPPWLSPGEQSQLPSVVQLTPADALVGIEPSEIDRLVDGRPLETNGETLLRVLYRVPQINLANVHRFVAETQGVDLHDVIAAPDLFRLSMFRLRGTALYVEQLLIESELAERFEMSHYYRVLFREAQTQRVVWMVTPQVPSNWPLEQSMAETTGFDGLLLMTISDDPPEAFDTDFLAAPPMAREQGGSAGSQVPEVQLPRDTPLFVARRLEWFPVRPRTDGEVPFGWRWLAVRGMDASLWESIEQSDRKPLGREDSECFYQGLAALARDPLDSIVNASEQTAAIAERHGIDSINSTAKLDVLQHGPLESWPLFDLLKSPEGYRGELRQLSGNIRRITRIEIDTPYFSDRLNLTHYYQIDLFVKLEPNQVVRMSTSDGSPGPEFRGKYPVTLCVTQLPTGLEPTDDINLQVTVDAHFFKIWSYPSRYVEQYDPQIRQLGPLFIARELEVNEQSVQPVALTIIAGIVLAVSLGGAWLGAWALGRREARPIKTSAQSPVEADPDFLKRLAEEDEDHETG